MKCAQTQRIKSKYLSLLCSFSWSWKVLRCIAGIPTTELISVTNSWFLVTHWTHHIQFRGEAHVLFVTHSHQQSWLFTFRTQQITNQPWKRKHMSKYPALLFSFRCSGVSSTFWHQVRFSPLKHFALMSTYSRRLRFQPFPFSASVCEH